MSEENQNNAAAQEQGSQFSLQRLYIKDLSYEAPKSPDVFRKEWAPQIELQLGTSHDDLGENFYEVVLKITVTARNDDEVAFIAEVEQAGIFMIQGLDEASLGHALGSFGPSLLFPYAREALDSIVIKGSFPALMLAPVNFDALYAQGLQRQQEAAEDGEEQA